MNFRQNTGKSIQKAFDEFHANNPNVYTEFKRLAFEAIIKGKKKISFKLLLNVVRWEVFMKTTDTVMKINGEEKQFKINDAYSSRYARVFIDEFPDHAAKIELRELRS